MRQMSGQDAAFLYGETPNWHMHVSALMVLDPSTCPDGWSFPRFKRLLVDPMLRHGVLPLAIATMALAIGIKEAVKQFFSAEASPFPSIVPVGDVSIFGRAVSLQSLGVLALAIATVLLSC